MVSAFLVERMEVIMDTLHVKRKDGKVFEVSKKHDGYHIIENRGLDGRFEAVRSDILWSRIEPFASRIQAYAWLKKNVGCLL